MNVQGRKQRSRVREERGRGWRDSGVSQQVCLDMNLFLKVEKYARYWFLNRKNTWPALNDSHGDSDRTNHMGRKSLKNRKGAGAAAEVT